MATEIFFLEGAIGCFSVEVFLRNERAGWWMIEEKSDNIYMSHA